jgi:hypothetical protein
LAANGLLGKPFTVIISFILIATYTIYQFVIQREKLTNPEFWFSVIGTICFFATISIHLYLKFSNEEALTKTLTTKNSLLQDSIIRQQNQIYTLQDSLQNSKAYIISAETTNVNANQKLSLAVKYFEIQHEPSINIVSQTSIFEIGKPISVRYIFENTGESISQLVIYGDITLHTVPYNEFTLHDSTKSVFKNFSRNEKKWVEYSRGEKLTKERYDAITANQLYVYVYGRFDYIDQFNHRYQKDVCGIYDKDIKNFRDNTNHKFIYEKTKTRKQAQAH